MFNSNIFEAKLPVKLQLDKKYISITENKKQEDIVNTPKNAALLHKAVKGLDYKQVEKLLKEGVSPDITVDGYTPFYNLVTGNADLEMAKLLIQYGADISKPTADFVSIAPFDMATCGIEERLPLIPLMLESAVPNPRDSDIKSVVDINDSSILNNAYDMIKKGDFNTLDLLIKHGLKLEQKDNTQLLNVAIQGLSKAREENLPQERYLKLIDDFASKYNQEKNKQAMVNDVTPIMLASQLGQTDIIEKLANAGHNPNQHLSAGIWKEPTTALMQATNTGNLYSVKKLLEVGAKLEEKDEFGRTAYYLAKTISELTYEQFKNLSYKNERKTRQEYLKILQIT
ncbi:ankyrin repeat domain-containing protein [Candidatus Rickettsia kedanie]|uniref:Ankyrin repeat protein n=1 Tax=Candidatus Rickettsia kedanie TaxID=3115352 RepID=A0ABP9TV41_9RICK